MERGSINLSGRLFGLPSGDRWKKDIGGDTACRVTIMDNPSQTIWIRPETITIIKMAAHGIPPLVTVFAMVAT